MKLTFGYAILFLPVLWLFSAIPAKAQTGVIQGRVKLQGSKTHAGVTIRLTKAQSAYARSNKTNAESETQEVVTNDKGDFEIKGLATGDYVLSFSKQGYRGFTTRKMEVLSGETLKLRNPIEMAKEGDPYAVIRGAVLHGVGFTLPNALVTIERIDGKKFKEETISREGGEFSFRLKPDKATYRITAKADGFQTASSEITIESDEVRNVVLTLQQVK